MRSGILFQSCIGLAVAVFLAGVVAASTAEAAVQCTFNRDLEFGIDGEDVRCLQRYLNDAGFTVAESGVGSPGNETSLFRTLTEEAVIEWQEANNVSPASGMFGSVSRATYERLRSQSDLPADTDTADPQVLGESTSTTNTSESVTKQKAELEQKLHERTISAIKAALEKIEDAEEDIDNSRDEDGDLNDAQEELWDAKDDIIKAMRAFFEEDYTQANGYARVAKNNAEDAIEESGRDELRDEADDAIERAREAIEDAEDEIEDAEAEGADVDEAEDELDDARDELDDAEDEFDDRDFDRAIRYAERAEELAEDAEDEIEHDEREDAKDAIDDAEDAIDDAWERYEDARDDDIDTNDADDYLDDAEDLLEEAEEAYDDGDYDEAEELAEEAEELAEDAEDEIED